MMPTMPHIRVLKSESRERCGQHTCARPTVPSRENAPPSSPDYPAHGLPGFRCSLAANRLSSDRSAHGSGPDAKSAGSKAEQLG